MYTSRLVITSRGLVLGLKIAFPKHQTKQIAEGGRDHDTKASLGLGLWLELELGLALGRE